MYYKNRRRTWGGTLHLLPLPDVATSACIYSMLQRSIRQRLLSNRGGCSPGYQALPKAPELPGRFPAVTSRSTGNSHTSPAFRTAGTFGAWAQGGEGIPYFLLPGGSWLLQPPPGVPDTSMCPAGSGGDALAVPSGITKPPGIPPAPWTLSRRRRKRRLLLPPAQRTLNQVLLYARRALTDRMMTAVEEQKTRQNTPQRYLHCHYSAGLPRGTRDRAVFPNHITVITAVK